MKAGQRTFVLVGGGQASAVAARTLRRSGFDGAIVVVGDEPDRPYQRPPLSKDYLENADPSSLELLPVAWTDEHDVEVRTGTRAVEIASADGAVVLDDGSLLKADAVLIGTGSRARQVPSWQVEGVHHLRTRRDADAIRGEMRPGARAVLVGAGFIGAELASMCRAAGVEVVMLEAGAVPMAAAIGDRLGRACADVMRSAGVDLRVNTGVDSIARTTSGLAVTTSEGVVEGDFVVVGIGAVPNDEIAAASGIAVNGGVVVDQWCRTSQPNVFAAGDVANAFHPALGRHLRVEHFDNASRQASVAARNMLGEAAIHDEPHWFWSDQFGRNLQYVGHASASDALVVRGDLAADQWAAFFMRDNVVTAAFGMDAGEEIALARELIRHQIPVETPALTDVDLDLFELLETA